MEMVLIFRFMSYAKGESVSIGMKSDNLKQEFHLNYEEILYE